MALFVRLEFGAETTDETKPWWRAFLGWRSGTLLALFALYGLTNMAKGLVFGPLMAGVPLAAYCTSCSVQSIPVAGLQLMPPAARIFPLPSTRTAPGEATP